MKRYTITSTLILLIMASLGTYYAYGAELRLPEYQLQTIEGDLAEASKLTLLGSYVGGKGSYPIEVSTAGSKRTDQTSWDQWMKSKGSLDEQTFSEFKALYKEHPGFMRGKKGTDGYYSDQDSLIFAKASYIHSKDTDQEGKIRWSIDSLDLATGKQIRYTDELLDSVQYANVIDVQKTGSEIHVLTNINRVNQDNEIIDKVFNAETGSPIRSVQVPLGESSRNDRELQKQIIAEEKPTAANPRVLFMVKESSKHWTDGRVSVSDTIPEVFSERIFEYHYASGEVKELPLAAGEEENIKGLSTQHILEGLTYTTLRVSEEAVTVDRYDLSTGLVHPQVTITAGQLSKGKISQARAANGRIYLLLQTGEHFANNSMPITAVADIADGRILYQGTPAPVKANGRPDDQIDDVTFLNIKLIR
ncbi:hypothetical protein [Paenibacillus borealis]|uniref:Uncharacterized protein n=1 Tax=Paenibacillus borealis TaxID=160799 RepID=A0A089LBA1_PAEBO|nr:hypothetical protein [Paenibacillus borealis]AIQ58781.1 hypothetical protein PBOR_18960 [Paenibacillus borealis]